MAQHFGIRNRSHITTPVVLLLGVTSSKSIMKALYPWHAPETGTINRLHFSAASFCYMWRANMGLNSSVVFQATKWHTPDWSDDMSGYFFCPCYSYVLSTFVLIVEFIICVDFRHVYFWCQKFSFQTYMIWKTSARKWGRFMAECVSGECVMGIRLRHLKSDRDEIWQGCSSPEYSLIYWWNWFFCMTSYFQVAGSISRLPARTLYRTTWNHLTFLLIVLW